MPPSIRCSVAGQLGLGCRAQAIFAFRRVSRGRVIPPPLASSPASTRHPFCTRRRPDGSKKAYVRLTTDYDALDVANKIGII